MAYRMRRMRREDVHRVTEIDREAFPTQVPAPNYSSELRNQTAFFCVACCDDAEQIHPPPPPAPRSEKNAGLLGWISRLFKNNNNSAQPPTQTDNIVGFVGSWFMVDEVHVTAIAVSETHRRQGIGELLLASAIDLAMEMKAEVVTLEVRVSNTGAQSLYSKYGFNRAGVRKGYYTDNREDALIMTTDNLKDESFKRRFQQLKEALHRRHGANIPSAHN